MLGCTEKVCRRLTMLTAIGTIPISSTTPNIIRFLDHIAYMRRAVKTTCAVSYWCILPSQYIRAVTNVVAVVKT